MEYYLSPSIDTSMSLFPRPQSEVAFCGELFLFLAKSTFDLPTAGMEVHALFAKASKTDFQNMIQVIWVATAATTTAACSAQYIIFLSFADSAMHACG